MGADGATPVANTAVRFSVAAGSASFAACAGASTCTLLTGANGLATTSVTPAAVGAIILQAAAGPLSQQASFNAIAQAAGMVALSTPESPLRVGVVSTSAFAVADVGPDGKTPIPFRAITFTATAGAATFDACYASPCTVMSDYTGTAKVGVIPQSLGQVTVQARDGDVSQTVTVTALSNTDILSVTNAPPAQYYTTDDLHRFAVTLLHADGTTPDSNQPVTFSAPAGVSFNTCAQSSCTVSTDGAGVAALNIIAGTAGTYTVQASFGSLVQAVTFTVIQPHWQLKILSAPADNTPTGVQATQPFQVQIVLADGVTPAPVAGRSMLLGGGNGAVTIADCIYSACEYFMGGDATATAWITPQQPGPITLSATFAPLVTTATFNAVGGVRTMKIAMQPGAAGAPLNRESDLEVEVIEPDGVTPMPTDFVTFTVLSGPYALLGGLASVTYTTGGDGIGFVAGVAGGNGPVVVQATDGYVTKLISFTAGTPARVMKLVSTPASPATTGIAAPVPFAVQVFAADGITPAAGEQVTFTLTGGAASLGGCASATCVVTADAQGIASVTVTPLVAGVVGLLAADGSVTQATSFTAVVPPDVLRVTSAPASGGYAGVPAGLPFAVQVLLGDGVTPGAGKAVTLSVTAGSATFAGCAGAVSCTLIADASGMVSSAVTPSSAGTIILQAADAGTIATASFTTIARPDTLQLVSAPSGTLPTGVLAATAFSVKLLGGHGTPDAGKAILFTASGAQFTGCSAQPCTVLTGTDGSTSLTLTPTTAGNVTLTATYGALTQTATFTAYTRPDTLQLVSAPSGTLPTEVLASTAFAVKLLAADGTADAGRTIAFSAAGAQFTACSNQPCAATTGADGTASISVTPTTAGTITLTATYGSLTQTATFTAYTRPDTLQLVSAPSGTLPTGVLAAPAFTVRLLGGDGTADQGKAILFTATGAQFTGCSTQPCTVLTGTDGSASLTLTPTTAGTVTLTATYGALTQTATFTAYARPDTLQLVSAPSGTLPTGVLAAPAFTVRLLAGDGTADQGKAILFTATGAQFTGCSAQPCTVLTGTDGSASLTLTPTTAGNVTLTASFGSLTQTATFAAAARPDTMRLISAPAGTRPTGVQVATPFAVQVLLADGTPDAGRSVVFTAAGAQLGGCTVQPCTVVTAGDGTASVAIIPQASGIVTLMATYGSLSETASFTAYTRPDTLKLLSTPASGGYVGVAAAVPFAVQVLAGDGTPAPGHSVTLSVAGGVATFAACAGASPCTLAADASGVVSTSVVPGAAGSITLLATDAQASVSATFSAVANQYSLTALNPTTYVAEGAVAEVIVGVTAQQNGLPAASQPVHWTGGAGFQPAASDTVTGSTGQSIQAATAGPLAAGAQGSGTTCAWSGTCAAFTVQGVSAAAFQPAVTAGAAQVASSLGPVTVTVTDLAGHPVAGAPISLYQTVRAYAAPCPAQGRCPAAAVLASLVTVAASDANGRYTLSPLTVDGLATQTEIAVAAGTQGFTTTTLTRQP